VARRRREGAGKCREYSGEKGKGNPRIQRGGGARDFRKNLGESRKKSQSDTWGGTRTAIFKRNSGHSRKRIDGTGLGRKNRKKKRGGGQRVHGALKGGQPGSTCQKRREKGTEDGSWEGMGGKYKRVLVITGEGGIRKHSPQPKRMDQDKVAMPHQYLS